jgi:cobalt-zinc-cadmium efflux system protein
MLLNFAITVVEIVGGLWSGSLSLLSDALHNLSDGLSIVLTWGAIRLTERRNSARHTYGLKRAEIVAAFINAAVLLAITLFLFQHAALRLFHPEPVDGGLMTVVALFGLAANVVGTLLLRRGSEHSMNLRSAYLHLLSDAASSAAVVVGGLAILRWQAYWVDPVLTILIGVYVLRESMRLLAQALHVLMEGAPPGLDLDALRRAVEALPDVENLHHLHVWTVGEQDVHLSAHVNVRDMRISDGDGLRRAIEELLSRSFGVTHATIQLECGQCGGVGLIRE